MSGEGIEYVPAKSLINRNKSSWWFGAKYNLNIYRGCNQGCIYCDSRSNCYGVQDFDRVRAKANALEILRDDLRRKVQTAVVATGAMSDPYNHWEKKLFLTRHSLELLSAYKFGVAIATKNDLIVRDTDILQEIKNQSPVIAKITITTPHDELGAIIEKGAPSPTRRFKAIKELRNKGIYAGVLLMPLLPWISDKEEDILLLVDKAGEAGAKFILPYFGLTLRDGQREYFYNALDKNFPHLTQKYKDKYKDAYSCYVPQNKSLSRAFTQRCDRWGMAYDMGIIVKEYKLGYESEQLSFFKEDS